MKKMKMSFFFLLFFSYLSFSQNITIHDKPYTEKNKSILNDITDENSITSIKMNKLNNDSLVEFEKNKNHKGSKIRFGVEYYKIVDIIKEGTWDKLPSGDKICRIKIDCPGANSINFIFNRFLLPKGASLYFYNKDRTLIFGGFGNQNNQSHKHFSTIPIPSDNLILELLIPKEFSNDSCELQIQRIIYGFRNLSSINLTKGKGSNILSNDNDNKIQILPSCSKEVNCLSSDWCKEKLSVAKLTLGGNQVTGSLLNSYYPIFGSGFYKYILTGYGLLDGSVDENHRDDILDNDEKAEAVNIAFEFDYYRLDCNRNSNMFSPRFSFCGSTFKSYWDKTGFLLLEPSYTFTLSDNRYYSGWYYSSTNIPSLITCMHIPMDGAMQGSQSDGIIQTSYNEDINYPVYWKWEPIDDEEYFDYNSGGAPCFDENHRIIGQAHGAFVMACSGNADVYTGKLSESWIGGGIYDSQLQHWLDPNWSSGDRYIDGSFGGDPVNLFGWLIDPDVNGVQGYINSTPELAMNFSSLGELKTGSHKCELFSNSFPYDRYGFDLIPYYINMAGCELDLHSDIPFITSLDALDQSTPTNPSIPVIVNLTSSQKITIGPCTKILYGTKFTAKIGCNDSYISTNDDINDYSYNCCNTCGNKKPINQSESSNNKFNETQLIGNKPNPFNETTEIQFYIESKGFVQITIMDLYGNVVGIPLKNENNPAGYGKAIFNSRDLPSGVYFYNLQTTDFSETKQMLIIK